MKARRSVAGVMAALVLCMSVIVPVREAKAVAPVVVGMALVNAAGSILASDALLTTGLNIIGGMAVAAIFLTPGDSSSVGVAVPLVADPVATAAAIPAPVAPVSAGAPVNVITYRGGGQIGLPTFSAGCQAAYAWAVSQSSGIEYQLVEGAGTCGYKYMTWNGWSGVNALSVGMDTTLQCTSGYVLTGGTCVLNSAREAVEDKRVDLYVGANGYLSFNADKDVKPPNVAAVGADCLGCGRIWGNNSSGQAFVTTITPSVEGGSVIETQTQISSSSGSAVKSDVMTISPAGVITSASSTVAAGSVGAGSVAGVAPTVSTTAPTTTTQPIVFPDDYARQNTLTQVAINTGTLASALTMPATGVVDPTIPGAAAFNDSFFKDTFNGVLGWSLPGHSSACPTSSFDAFGRSFFVDSHCALVDNNFGAIRQAMVVVYLLLAMFIVLKA